MRTERISIATYSLNELKNFGNVIQKAINSLVYRFNEDIEMEIPDLREMAYLREIQQTNEKVKLSRLAQIPLDLNRLGETMKQLVENIQNAIPQMREVIRTHLEELEKLDEGREKLRREYNEMIGQVMAFKRQEQKDNTEKESLRFTEVYEKWDKGEISDEQLNSSIMLFRVKRKGVLRFDKLNYRHGTLTRFFTKLQDKARMFELSPKDIATRDFQSYYYDMSDDIEFEEIEDYKGGNKDDKKKFRSSLRNVRFLIS